MISGTWRGVIRWIGVFGLAVMATTTADAGWPFSRRAAVPTRVVTPTVSRPVIRDAPSPMLGTFYPEPYVYVRGNMNAGGGYSPLGEYGYNAMSLYGPLSDYRRVSAPIVTYNRGYDGSVRPVVGTSFSNPNLRAKEPVIYPTRGNYFYGFRNTGTPPWWDSPINWIDQN